MYKRDIGIFNNRLCIYKLTKVLTEPCAKVLAEPCAKVLAEPCAKVLAEPCAKVLAEPCAKVLLVSVFFINSNNSTPSISFVT